MRKQQIFMIFILIISMISLNGCSKQGLNEHLVENSQENNENINDKENIMKSNEMKIRVSSDWHKVIFLLNNSEASKSLYEQLPLDIVVENYGSNEKIFYPPQTLDIQDTPLLKSGGVGTLGYFALWDNVVMYFGSCEAYNGLYVLGEAITGGENIENLSGFIHIEKIET
ncbi:MAG: cyclophilin-like fold protein [Thomasclavelia sp.]|uniref:cyclophilin-like fold protein n=1 Tax=Thomasclavelia sp. TaxID=3025757 RepID=UPI0039A27733